MRKLIIHKDAEGDLEGIGLHDPDTADDLLAMLQELSGSQDLLDRLTQHDFGQIPEAGAFSVSEWREQQRTGNNLWRLKFWELEEIGIRYRVIYAFFPQTKYHFVLGIMPRRGGDFDYQHDDPRTQRILRTYSELKESHR